MTVRAETIGAGYAERRDYSVANARENIEVALLNFERGAYHVAARCLREAAAEAERAAGEHYIGLEARRVNHGSG